MLKLKIFVKNWGGMLKMVKIIQTKGKRKRAVARATLKEGIGKVRVNGQLLNLIEPNVK